MPPSSNIQWIDRATGAVAPCSAAEIMLRDDDLWPGIHIERWRCGQVHIKESIARTHIISVTLVNHNHTEFYYAGEGWRRGTRVLGSIKVTPAGVPFAAKSSEWRGLVMSIDPEFLSVAGGGGQIELRPQGFVNDGLLVRLALALERDIVDGHPVGSAYGETVSETLAAHLIRNFSTQSPVLPDSGVGLSNCTQTKIRDYIFSNLHRPLHVAELAKLVQMDTFAFQRAFKQSFAAPPHRYILGVRVEHAISLVTNTSLPLVQIAITCGFSSQSHMTTLFRRFTGRPPGDYRAHHKMDALSETRDNIIII
jgi:AraC family transcriptional regulator